MRHHLRRAGAAVAATTATLGLLTTTATAAGATPAAYQHALATEVVTTAWQTRAALEDAGLDVEDVLLPDRDDDFYEQVAAGLQDWLTAGAAPDAVEPPPAPPTAVDPDAHQTASRLAYAAHIAEVNRARDPRAEDIASETVYMYLSHYVDTRGQTSPTLDAYSNGQFLAAWLTPTDRQAYRTFLNHGSMIESAGAIFDAATAINDLRGVATSLARDGLKTLGDKVRAANEVHGARTSVHDALKALDKAAAWSSSDPAEVVSALTGHGQWDHDEYQRVERRAVVGVVTAAALIAVPGGGAAFLGAVALHELSMVKFVATSFLARVNYTAMAASNSGRLAERLMRYNGW